MTSASIARLRRFAPYALLLAGGLVALGFARSRPVPVSTVAVDRGPVVREAIGTGTLESEVVLEVAFTIPGRLAEVRFHEGDHVRAGDVLAVLDAEQESQRVAVARRNVALASHGVARAAADVRRADATLQAATLDLRRLEQLYASGATSASEVDAMRERHARAEAELAAATAGRQQGTSGLSVARAALELDASLADETVVRSPLDGIVVHRHLEPGAVLASGEVVLTIASTELVWARVWLDETTLPELREGQPALVELRGDEARRLRARVDRIGVETDRETHEVLVDLELLELPERLVFGRRLDGYVELGRKDAVLRVPRGSCDEARGRCAVLREGRIVEASARFGMTGTDHVEVLEGLPPSSRVVVPPSDGSPLPLGRTARESGR